MPTQEGIIIGW